MGLPGIRYELWGYIGERDGSPNEFPTDGAGYKFCLYDSKQELATNLLVNPVLSISENTSGTVDFTILRNAKTTIYYKTAGSQQLQSYSSLQNPRWFMLIKQTELVLFRSILKVVNGTKVLTERKELWSGRVNGITKDFYGDWAIKTEGELAYLNDFTLDYSIMGDSTPQAETLFLEFLVKFNNKVSAHSSVTGNLNVANLLPRDGGETAPVPTVRQINRRFYSTYGFINIKQPNQDQAVAATIANLDSGYSVSDGSSVWSNIQTLLDLYGGHLEIVKEKQADNTLKRNLYWSMSGTASDATIGYHNPSNPNKIYFGVNLLNYSDENDASELYTVLIPHGQTQTETTQDEDGTTKTVEKGALTIKLVNAEHPDTPYIYDLAKVQKYGWVEKVETWNISNDSQLYKIAKAYYNDLRIGSTKITIKAYDLKNLVTCEDDASKRSMWLGIDSLYLYDCVQIASFSDVDPSYPDKPSSMTSESMPIQEIRIPLDKFPTDTEYVISNKKPRRAMLSPGTLSSKQQTTKPPTNEDNQKEEETTQKEKVVSITPIGDELGVDDDLPHYPPIYMDHAFDYIKAPMGVTTDNREGSSTTLTFDPKGIIPYQRRDAHGNIIDEALSAYKYFASSDNNVHYAEWSEKTPDGRWRYKPFTVTVSGSTIYGCNKDDLVYVDGAGIATTTNNIGCVFYTDDITNKNSLMRVRKSGAEETQSNYYEKVLDDRGEHKVAELDPFVDAGLPFYKTAEASDANIIPVYNGWAAMYGGEHLQPPKKNFGNENVLKLSGSSANSWASVRQQINQTPCFGSTIGDILASIKDPHQTVSAGVWIDPQVTTNDYIYMSMQYGTNSENIIKMSTGVRWKPESFSDDKSTFYRIGVKEIGDTALIYYVYYSAGATANDDHENEYDDAFANSELVRLGLYDPNKIPNAPDVMYYKTVTLGGRSCHVPASEGEEGAQLTEYGKEYSDWMNSITDEMRAQGYTLPTRSHSESFMLLFYRSAAAHYNYTFQEICMASVRRAAGATGNLTGKNAYSADVTKKKIAYANAYGRAMPLMAIMKTKQGASGEQQDSYGVVFFGANSNGMSLTKESGNDYYTINNTSPLASMAASNGSAISTMPVMISKDTLTEGTKYLFDDDDDQFVIVNGNSTVLPMGASNQAPIMVMAKCGGVHTANIANNAYFRLSGDTYASYGVAEEPISPISGTKDYKIGIRTESRIDPASGNTPKRIWYYGSDMMKITSASGRYSEYPLSLTSADKDNIVNDENTMSLYYHSTLGRQPFANGSSAFLRVTPNFFIKYPTSNNGGDS